MPSEGRSFVDDAWCLNLGTPEQWLNEVDLAVDACLVAAAGGNPRDDSSVEDVDDSGSDAEKEYSVVRSAQSHMGPVRKIEKYKDSSNVKENEASVMVKYVHELGIDAKKENTVVRSAPSNRGSARILEEYNGRSIQKENKTSVMGSLEWIEDEEAPVPPTFTGIDGEVKMPGQYKTAGLAELIDSVPPMMPPTPASLTEVLHHDLDSAYKSKIAGQNADMNDPARGIGNNRPIRGPVPNTERPQQDEGAPNDNAAPTLEATLVQGVEATLIMSDRPNEKKTTVSPVPVYPGTLVQDDEKESRLSWWNRHRQCILSWAGLIVGTAATASCIIAAAAYFTYQDSLSSANASKATEPVLQSVPTFKPSSTPSLHPSRFESHNPSAESSIDDKSSGSPSKLPDPADNEYSLEWSQLSTIEGATNAGDDSSQSVRISSDGKTVAIGEQGKVAAYRWDESFEDFIPLGSSLHGDAASVGFGSSVDLSADGKVLAVGAPRNDENGHSSGQVIVYALNDNSEYVQLGQDLHGGLDHDLFGSSISLSADGRLLVVGAPGDKTGNRQEGWTYFNDRPGFVRIYEWDQDSMNYVQLQAVYGDAPNDEFGWSVALSGDGSIMAAGANSGGGNQHQSGQVEVYKRSDSSSAYKQVDQSLYGDPGPDWSASSFDLSSDGKTLAIAATGHDTDGSSFGQVKVCRWNEAETKFEQVGDPIYGEIAGDFYGDITVTLSADGNELVAGVNQWFDHGSGYVEIFGFDEATSDYKQLSGAVYQGWFGSLSGDGTTLAVGAPNNNIYVPGIVSVFNIEF